MTYTEPSVLGPDVAAHLRFRAVVMVSAAYSRDRVRLQSHFGFLIPKKGYAHTTMVFHDCRTDPKWFDEIDDLTL